MPAWSGGLDVKKIVGIVAAVVVLIVVGVAGYLATLDAEDFRDTINEQVRDATGRDFAIAGPMELAISFSPRIVASDITLANAPWGSRPEMAKIRKFEIVVQLLPLLSGNMEIDRIILIEPDILLETDAKGRGNWEFETAGKSETATAKGGDRAAGDDAGSVPTIGELLIENGILTWRDGKSGQTTKIALARLAGSAKSASAPLTFDGKATVNDIALAARGSVGPLAALGKPGKTVNLDVAADALGLSLTAKGNLVGTRVDVAVNATADDLKGLNALAGGGLPTGLPFSLASQVRGDAAAVELSGLKLALGGTDAAGDVKIALAGKRPAIAGKIASKRIDLNQLLPKQEPAGGTAASGGEKPKRVFPTDPLPLDGLAAADADLQIDIAEVAMTPLPLQNVGVRIVLKDRQLTVDPAGLTVAGSKLGGRVALDGRQSKAGLKVALNGPGLDVGRLLKESGTTDLVEGKGDFAVTLDGRGASVAELMGSLDGETKLLMGEGRMRTKAFDNLVGGLSALMGTLSSGKQEWTVLNCVASKFDIKKGIATSQILLADTEYATTIGEGSIDLGQETLAMKVSPQSKSATLNMAVPVKIGGTFMEPTFRPDELATARRLGSLFGGLVFPPLALGALADMGTGEDNPCLKIAKGGDQAAKPAATKQEPSSPASQAGDAAKGAVDSVTKGLKGLFGGSK
jgi:uncharacterized protein involved in outer membrane biogenesis